MYANNRYQPQSAAIHPASLSDRELCAYAAGLINKTVVIIGSIRIEDEVEDCLVDMVLREGHTLTEAGRGRVLRFVEAAFDRLRKLMAGDVATDARHGVHPLPNRPLLAELGLTIAPPQRTETAQQGKDFYAEESHATRGDVPEGSHRAVGTPAIQSRRTHGRPARPING